MISMVHRDGDTTIQMVEIDDHFEVSLQHKGEPDVRVWHYDNLEAALAGYVLTVTAEIGCYVGRDLPWYAAVNAQAKHIKMEDQPNR
jgi:hypothetical protein